MGFRKKTWIFNKIIQTEENSRLEISSTMTLSLYIVSRIKKIFFLTLIKWQLKKESAPKRSSNNLLYVGLILLAFIFSLWVF